MITYGSISLYRTFLIFPKQDLPRNMWPIQICWKNIVAQLNLQGQIYDGIYQSYSCSQEWQSHLEDFEDLLENLSILPHKMKLVITSSSDEVGYMPHKEQTHYNS
jgi:hypothetical protein